MLDAFQTLAHQHGLGLMEADVNLNRSRAYRSMLGRGFRAVMYGVAMHRNDSPARHRPDAYIADDLR